VTGNIRNRIPIFKNQQCCLDFFGISADLRIEWPAKIIAYVLMPEHFHLIVNPRDGDIQGFVGALKSKLASKIIEVAGPRFLLATPEADGSIHQVWQESFKVVPLWSSWMIWQKINYIHANPVKARLVKSAKDYRWSSFGVLYNGATEPLTVDHDWWWPDDSEKLSKAMKKLGWRTYHYRQSNEK
jgi:putative transposase